MPRASSPSPSSLSASDYSPEPTSATPKRRRTMMTAEERRDARAHRNRLAAQSSRDRKKAQYEQLSIRVNELEEENRALRMGITSTGVDRALEQENAQLRERIQNLEQAWQNMTKIIGAFAIPSTTQTTPKFDFPVSPTAPSLSVSDSTADASSEPTCEPARFVNVSLEASLQRVAPSARSLVLRLLSEQQQQTGWERPRCTTILPQQPPPFNPMSNSVSCH